MTIVAEARCQDCGQRLPDDAAETRRYCDRDRHRRRAISYLKAGRGAALAAGRITDAAEIAEIVRRLEVSR